MNFFLFILYEERRRRRKKKSHMEKSAEEKLFDCHFLHTLFSARPTRFERKCWRTFWEFTDTKTQMSKFSIKQCKNGISGHTNGYKNTELNSQTNSNDQAHMEKR